MKMAETATPAETTPDQLYKTRQRYGKSGAVFAARALRQTGRKSHGGGESTIKREKSEPETKEVT